MSEQPRWLTAIEAALCTWMARQRWYRVAAGPPVLQYAGHLDVPQAPQTPQVTGATDATGESNDSHDSALVIRTVMLRDVAGSQPVTYQVPLTFRDRPAPQLEPALITAPDPEQGQSSWVYDAPHDPAYATALLHPMTDRHIVSASVLTGEQSNTSIIVQATTASEAGGQHAPAPVIVKVFRVLQPGANPDVQLQSALHQAGCRYVPAAVGELSGAWREADGTLVSGHLVFAQEFLPGTRDAWRVATDDLAAGLQADSFQQRAHELGAATAAVHQQLAQLFPTVEATPERRATLLDSWRSRWERAAHDAPQLAPWAPQVQAVFEAAARVRWPRLQRIHGDYHLGQVLDVPGRGWVLLDFEGEPLRSLDERNAPDLAARDVAGMLRSFDYAAGAHRLAHPQATPTTWASVCRDAFVAGYATVADSTDSAHSADSAGSTDSVDSAHSLVASDSAALLAALELDKALYEVSYEARFRPDWSPIPIAAVARLIGTHPPPVVPAHPDDDRPAGPYKSTRSRS